MQTFMARASAAFFVCTLALLVAACGSDDDPQDFEAGSLGAVGIGAGETIQIRTMLSHTGFPTYGLPLRYAIELAVRDTGDIHGREVELGEPIDEMCSGAGGKAGALEIISDPRQIVGVLGTSCSVAAITASPLLSGAGLVMISPSNTVSDLTSDLEGNVNPDYYPGYFRTSNNSLYEAQAVADFAYHELELRRMVTVDNGHPFGMALAVSFANAFRSLGGEAAAHQVELGQMDMTDILAGIAAGHNDAAPLDGIFFPIFADQGSRFAEQVKAFPGLKDLPLITDSGLLTPEFLSTPQSLDVYFAGPVPMDDANVNEVSGKSVGEVLAAYRAMYGEPEAPFWIWMPAYDAATLLLSAIEAVGETRGGRLYVDRAALRDAITETQDFEGLLGMLSCDEFGDCGTGEVSIYHHTDPSITDPADLEPIYP